jgi:hypothetical protein
MNNNFDTGRQAERILQMRTEKEAVLKRIVRSIDKVECRGG